MIDGCDKCGKDTLIKLIHEKTNYRHVIINRCLASNWVYGQLKNRKLDFREYLIYDRLLSRHRFIKQIILFSNKDDLTKRFKKHKETDIELSEIDRVQQLYLDYVRLTKIPTLKIDTSLTDINECIELILKWIN